MDKPNMSEGPATLAIGWAQADITPSETVLVCGQFYARLSEQVLDPLTATALAVESDGRQVVFVSCDLVGVPDPLRDAIRARLGDIPDLDPKKVIVHATHTHTAPEVRLPGWCSGTTSTDLGLEFEQEVMSIADYQKFAAERIADAVRRAWSARSPGKVAFGHGWAVVGHNRRSVDTAGAATMYGETSTPDFSHIEGYEDHSLGLVATYDANGDLSGLVVNVPCPSQCSAHLFALSADYWCETRAELRRRLGDGLFVLPQCSAAGDQSPHLLFGEAAEERMRRLKGLSERQEIARRIADAVVDVLPAIAPTADGTLPVAHRAQTIALPMNELTQEDVEAALAEAAKHRPAYEQEMQESPSLRTNPRWYKKPTFHFRRMRWLEGVAERFEKQKTQPTQPAELHVVRLGDLALATNPFEFYLDFGIRIKARSPAVETLLVQLAGGGTYCPSPRSLAGGGYGSIPASNPVGPEGGRRIVESTVESLQDLWQAGAAGRP